MPPTKIWLGGPRCIETFNNLTLNSDLILPVFLILTRPLPQQIKLLMLSLKLIAAICPSDSCTLYSLYYNQRALDIQRITFAVETNGADTHTARQRDRRTPSYTIPFRSLIDGELDNKFQRQWRVQIVFHRFPENGQHWSKFPVIFLKKVKLCTLIQEGYKRKIAKKYSRANIIIQYPSLQA